MQSMGTLCHREPAETGATLDGKHPAMTPCYYTTMIPRLVVYLGL